MNLIKLIKKSGERVTLEIYTDGSAAPNPGPGGWGLCYYTGLGWSYMNGQKDETTNNEMELTAILNAIKIGLQYIATDFVDHVVIISDSSYCINMINERWIFNWAASNWKNGKVKNLDLVKQIYEYIQLPGFSFKISFKKIPGHSGIKGNEIADALATNNTKKLNSLLGKDISIENQLFP